MCPAQTIASQIEGQLKDITGLDLAQARAFLKSDAWNCISSPKQCITRLLDVAGGAPTFVQQWNGDELTKETPVDGLALNDIVIKSQNDAISPQEVTAFTMTPSTGVAPLDVAIKANVLNVGERGLAHQWLLQEKGSEEQVIVGSSSEFTKTIENGGSLLFISSS
ncbi:MAG: hypothetical protein ACPGR2_06130 [Psychrobium sp.]